MTDQFLKVKGYEPVSMREVAAWAIGQDLWKQRPEVLIRQLANELADAVREDYIRDPQGRKVRAKHAVRVSKDGTQPFLWADMRSGPTQHFRMAFQQRRQGIVSDCRQLKVDVDSFNENYNSGQQIVMVFDFRDDLDELEALGA